LKHYPIESNKKENASISQKKKKLRWQHFIAA